jgi:hypothetical protein
MILVRPHLSAHWYSAEGQPSHTVIGANGKERSTTLRDARSLNLLPSVTGILGVLAKPGLEVWKQEQAILAALTLPRIDGESQDAFAQRVVIDMETQVERAAAFGTMIHSGIEEVNARGSLGSYPDEIGKWMASYDTWRRANLTRHLSSEKVVVGAGFAGRYDLLAEHWEHGRCLIDFKTQNIKGGKANFYDVWASQLAAYRLAMCGACRCLSVVMDSNQPSAPVEKLWTEDEIADGLEIFLCAKTIWQKQRGYAPAQ